MRTARLESRLGALLAASLSVLGLALALAVPYARADVGEQIIQRCTHGQSLAGFSEQAYRRALKELSADAEEYTDCASLIRQAQLAAASGRGGGPGAGLAAVVPVAATPTEQRALQRARSAPGAPLRLNGEDVRPGVVHASVSSAFSSLPTPLLALLAFIAACLSLLTARNVRDRIRARRSS